jgi:hypothetical protein
MAASETRPIGQPIPQDAICTIAGAARLGETVYLMVLPYGSADIHMLMFHTEARIWGDIAQQLGFEDADMIPTTPEILIGEEVYLTPHLREQYHARTINE